MSLESRLRSARDEGRNLVRACADCVKPGGLYFVTTINRTLKSFALAIVGAEYVLRWLPVGTHRWDKFVTSTLSRTGRSHPR